MHVWLLTHKSAKHREKGTPSHAKSRDCVSASGVLPKGGGVKRFRWGRGTQVPSFKPGGGVEGGKIRETEARGCTRKEERRGREEASSSPPKLLP